MRTRKSIFCYGLFLLIAGAGFSVATTSCSSDDKDDKEVTLYLPFNLQKEYPRISLIEQVRHLDAMTLRTENNIVVDTTDMTWSLNGNTDFTIRVKALDQIQIDYVGDDNHVRCYESYLSYGMSFFSQDQKNYDLYKSYVNELGDTLCKYENWASSIATISNDEVYQGALLDTICSIDITCNEPIDEAHPADSSLADLFGIVYADLLYTVKHGYHSCQGPDALSNAYWNEKGYAQPFRYEPLTATHKATKAFMGIEFFLYSSLNYDDMIGKTFRVVIRKSDGSEVAAECLCKRLIYDAKNNAFIGQPNYGKR